MRDAVQDSADMVIAPHPDDEPVGRRRALALLALVGGRLPGVLTLTHWRLGGDGSRRYPPTALRQLREQEARAAIAELSPPLKQLPSCGCPTRPRHGAPRISAPVV